MDYFCSPDKRTAFYRDNPPQLVKGDNVQQEYTEADGAGVQEGPNSKPSRDIEDIKREEFTKGLREGLRQARQLYAPQLRFVRELESKGICGEDQTPYIEMYETLLKKAAGMEPKDV